MNFKIISMTTMFSTLLGCSFGAPLTKEVYDEHLTRDYSYSKIQCIEATSNALSELSYEIDKQDKVKGKIITKRKDFTSQETRSTLAGNHVQTYDVNIANKFYISISKLNEESCTVKVDRFRVWYKGKELKEMNISYINEHQWAPIFKEIEEKLAENW